MSQMIHAKLLTDVAESGYSLKDAQKAAKMAGVKPPEVKVVRRPGKKPIAYLKGTIVTMHEDSAQKWLDRGLIEIVDAPAPEDAETETPDETK